MKRVGNLCGLTLVIVAISLCNNSAVAQQGGDFGGIPTVDPGAGAVTQQPIQQPIQQPATTGDQGATGNSADFQTGGEFDFGNILDQLTIPEIPEIENTRIQPFVGRSLSRFEDQTIQAHPRSNALAPGEVFSSGGGGGGGFTFGGRGGAGGNQQGLQGGASNSIIRRSLRTRLVPKIVVRNPVTPQQVSTRFQQRISTSPNLSDGGTGVQVRVENRTAYLTGVVSSQEERDRVERMARLEPGIYRIDNQIQVQP